LNDASPQAIAGVKIISATPSLCQTQTAFERIAHEVARQNAIATLEVERYRDEHRMVGEEATANSEGLDSCSYR
jgi:hypothetical protein